MNDAKDENIFSGDEDNGDRDAYIENEENHHSPRDDDRNYTQEDEEMKIKKALETIKEVTEENDDSDHEDSKK